VDVLAQAHSLESRLHAVERIQFEDGAKSDQFIPIYFVFTNKIAQNDKLRLAFDALILSETLGREISLGKIIHGESHITTKISTSTLISKVKKQIHEVSELISNNSPPDLILKRYCAECELQLNCREKALEKDDLSLLANMTRNERNLHRSKGIFTVNQLSYTFRPRRPPKRAKNPTNKHYPALQALATRENTVFIHGSPNYPK
jgi:predicted RecB family nuclease